MLDEAEGGYKRKVDVVTEETCTSIRVEVKVHNERRCIVGELDVELLAICGSRKDGRGTFVSLRELLIEVVEGVEGLMDVTYEVH